MDTLFLGILYAVSGGNFSMRRRKFIKAAGDIALVIVGIAMAIPASAQKKLKPGKTFRESLWF